MSNSKPFLRDAIHSHLRVHGAATVDELHSALVAAGVTASKTSSNVRSSVAGSRFTYQLPDGRWDITTRALTGVVLTVRPRSRLQDDVLWVHNDLEPFDGLLTGDSIPLATGGLARLGGGAVRTLLGPSGWLPEVPVGGLLGLRWNGVALEVFLVTEPVTTDSLALAPVRDLLRRHAEGLSRTTYFSSAPTLPAVILSALREVPDLFALPLPPLSEIYPLPEREVVDTSRWEAHLDGRRLTLHLPHRVYDELQRRAELLGEHLADHAAVLLGAATDRVRVMPVSGWDRGYYSSPDDDRYDEPNADVVRSLRSVPS